MSTTRRHWMRRTGAALWADRLGAALDAVLRDPALYRVEHY
jgi:hypothetical protein